MKWVIIFLACGNGVNIQCQETRAANMPPFSTRENCKAGLMSFNAGYAAAYRHSMMAGLHPPEYVCRPDKGRQ
jgi:hypothetical protein